MAGWQGLLAPANTPKDIVARREKAAMEAARTPLALARLKTTSANSVGSTAVQLADSIKRDLELYAEITKAAGLEKKQ
jgi:tripartite-type tricarboxylate transporter receptor subunit TctC